MYMQTPNELSNALDGVWVNDAERAELRQYVHSLACLFQSHFR